MTVVITGAGLISAAGRGVASLGPLMRSPRRALTPITAFDAGWLGGGLAGQIPPSALPGSAGGDRALSLCQAATREALAQAGLSPGPATGVVLGTSQGALEVGRPLHRPWSDAALKSAGDQPPEGPTAAEAQRRLTMYRPGHVAEALARHVGAGGPSRTLGMVCVSGLEAILHAAWLIERGVIDQAIAGGVDTFNEFVFAGFTAIGALDAAGARPFDEARAGTCLGEAAAVVVLERAEGAQQRGAEARATLLGGGRAADGVHPTAPDREGRGLARAITGALKAARLGPEAIDLICAHGTATPYNDPMECAAFEAVCGSGCPPLTGNKGALGHTLGAAGAVDVVWTLWALEHQHLPATAGLEAPIRPWIDPTPRTLSCEVALTTNAAFMGQNTAALLGQPPQSVQVVSTGVPPALIPVEQAPWIQGLAHHSFTGGKISARHPAVPDHRNGFLMDPAARVVMHASAEALVQAGHLSPESPESDEPLTLPPEAGVALGTIWGCHAANFAFDQFDRARGHRDLSARAFAATVHNGPAGWLAIRLGVRGDNLSFVSGQGADLEALDFGARAVARGALPMALCGGYAHLPRAHQTLLGGRPGASVAVVAPTRNPSSKLQVRGLLTTVDPQQALEAVALPPSTVTTVATLDASAAAFWQALPDSPTLHHCAVEEGQGAAGLLALAHLAEGPPGPAVVHLTRSGRHLLLVVERAP